MTDINDNIPQFVDVPDTCVRYAENVTGQDVVSLQVHDPDLDMNGEVQFMLTCVDKFGADCDGECLCVHVANLCYYYDSMKWCYSQTGPHL